jgi:uncharacterized protein (DUF1786 family)
MFDVYITFGEMHTKSSMFKGNHVPGVLEFHMSSLDW